MHLFLQFLCLMEPELTTALIQVKLGILGLNDTVCILFCLKTILTLSDRLGSVLRRSWTGKPAWKLFGAVFFLLRYNPYTSVSQIKLPSSGSGMWTWVGCHIP